jgi:hypothetical protein
MPAKIFLSCGQDSPEEKKVGEDLKNCLTLQGFEVFLAFKTQRMEDVDDIIIKNLESSDYFIFIDFRREKIKGFMRKQYRGSLFTNQELALAHYLKFEKAMFLQQTGIRLEGMTKYFLSNPEKFDSFQEVIDKVKLLIEQRRWMPTYSRQLSVKNLRMEKRPIGYRDHAGEYAQYVWFAHIENRRSRTRAENTRSRLVNVTDPMGKPGCPDRGLLKWAGQFGYERLIMPNEDEPFDAFAIDFKNHLEVYLHSAADVPREPIIKGTPGVYKLKYQVIAFNFPTMEFEVELKLTGNIETTKAELIRAQ